MRLAATLHDAVALADRRGPGTTIALGGVADISAPIAGVLQPAEIRAALQQGAASYFLCTSTHAAPLLEALATGAGTGFIAACLADPAAGRTVYQGHLFQGATWRDNLLTSIGGEISGRAGLVPHGVVAAGPAAIRTRLAALKDQGYMVALIDAISAADTSVIAAACAQMPLLAGPAWLAATDTVTETQAGPASRTAVISGALDRQTLYQIGAAGLAMPVRQLNFSMPAPELIADSLAWAAAQPGSFVIAASAPPDRLHPTAPAAEILAEITAGLIAAGIRRFLLTGNDSAAAILRHCRITQLTAGGAAGPLRALHAADCTFFIKPAEASDKNLFLDLIGPHNCLNAAAE